MKTIRDERFGPEHHRRWGQGVGAVCLAGLIGCSSSPVVTTDAGHDTGTSMDTGGTDSAVTDSGQPTDNGQTTLDVPITTDVPPTADVPVVTDAPPLTMPGAPTQLAGGPSFTRPLDVVLTASGATAYFIAFDGTTDDAEVFRSMGGTSSVIVPGGGVLDAPVGLAISADDSTLYIADVAANSGTGASTAGLGAIFSVGGEGGTPTAVNIGTGIRSPRAIAISGATGSEVLTFIATDTMGPGIFRVPTAGGTAVRLDTLGTLVDPVALTASSEGTVFILDAHGSNLGSVYQLASAGGVPAALPTGGPINGLHMRTPAGIALSLDEQSLFVSAWDPGNGTGLLTWMAVDGTSPTSPAIYAPVMNTLLVSPCGLHRAHSTEIFAVADELSTGTGAILSLH